MATQQTAERLPPELPFVPLPSALTWIAFGYALNSEALHEISHDDVFRGVDPQDAMKAAVAKLTARASAGRVSMRGKYQSSHNEDRLTLLTEAIEPMRFSDFCQFNYLHDELRYGTGLTFWRTPEGVVDWLGSGRSDSFVDVTVNREDLLREFPPHIESAPTIVSLIRLPDGWGTDKCSELPTWLNMFQLSAWVQYRDYAVVGRASDWTGLAGAAFRKDKLIGSVVDLENALQEGRLRAYGLRKGQTFTAIPEVEWTRLRLAPLDLSQQHPYLAIQVKSADALAIFPTLEATEARQKAKSVPKHRKLDHDWIRSRASEMLLEQPNLKKQAAALSIIAKLGVNPKTNKPWDYRHIERLIAPLWGDE